MDIEDIYRSLAKDERVITTKSQIYVVSGGRITRIYLICDDGKLLLTNTEITSNPPSGMCQITNIYWDPISKKAVFEYEDTPVP
jgi:hypothetical protein